MDIIDLLDQANNKRPFRPWFTREVDAQKYWTKGYEDCLRELKDRVEGTK